MVPTRLEEVTEYAVLPIVDRTVPAKAERHPCHWRLWLILAALVAFGLPLCHRTQSAVVFQTMQPRNSSSAVHCFFLLDSTGSMSAIREETIKGFNSYIDEQQGNSGTMMLTLITFNQCNPWHVAIEAQDVRYVKPLQPVDYRTTCGTPLFDALARTIDHAAIAANGQRDVIVVVMTDGAENASREHDRESVFRKVQQMKTEHGWTFVFLGANQDSFAGGAAMGMKQKAIANWQATGAGVAAAYSRISRATTNSRFARAHMAATASNEQRSEAFEI